MENVCMTLRAEKAMQNLYVRREKVLYHLISER